MKEEKTIKRCPMAMFGLCGNTLCAHSDKHEIDGGCNNHKHHCGANIGCSTIEPDGGLIVDAEAIEDFIFRFIGPKCSWYAFYVAMLKRIKKGSMTVTPRDEDLHLVKDVKEMLDDSIEEYKIAKMERDIVELVKDGGKTFMALNNLVSLWNLRDYEQSKSSLYKFLSIMEQKNLIEKTFEDAIKYGNESSTYYAICSGCGKSHKNSEESNECFKEMFGKEK